jgi:hypothetical protein
MPATSSQLACPSTDAAGMAFLPMASLGDWPYSAAVLEATVQSRAWQQHQQQQWHTSLQLQLSQHGEELQQDQPIAKVAILATHALQESIMQSMQWMQVQQLQQKQQLQQQELQHIHSVSGQSLEPVDSLVTGIAAHLPQAVSVATQLDDSHGTAAHLPQAVPVAAWHAVNSMQDCGCRLESANGVAILCESCMAKVTPCCLHAKAAANLAMPDPDGSCQVEAFVRITLASSISQVAFAAAVHDASCKLELAPQASDDAVAMHGGCQIEATGLSKVCCCMH